MNKFIKNMTNASDIRSLIDRTYIIGEIASMSFGISGLFDVINWPIHLVELFKVSVCQLNDVIRFIEFLGAHKHLSLAQCSILFRINNTFFHINLFAFCFFPYLIHWIFFGQIGIYLWCAWLIYWDLPSKILFNSIVWRLSIHYWSQIYSVQILLRTLK